MRDLRRPLAVLATCALLAAPALLPACAGPSPPATPTRRLDSPRGAHPDAPPSTSPGGPTLEPNAAWGAANDDFIEPDIYPSHLAACDALRDAHCESLCSRLVTTLTKAAARRSLDCFAAEQRERGDGALAVCDDACARVTCEFIAFDGPPTAPPDPRCETEVRAARPPGDHAPADLFADTCNAFTPHMNDVGRDRYIDCMRRLPAAGQRSCLWDFTRAPCGYAEKEGARSVDRDLDDD